MLAKTFVFQQPQEINTDSHIIQVTCEQLYNEATGFGFVTEENVKTEPLLQIPELNTGFRLCSDQPIVIHSQQEGCIVENGGQLPLCFKADVSRSGNYEITLQLYGRGEIFVYAGYHNLVRRETNEDMQPLTCCFTMNVSAVIPKGNPGLYETKSIDIAILGEHVYLQKLQMKKVNCPTLYIAGDLETTQDYIALPYELSKTQSDWALMLAAFMNKGIAVSKHVHLGMTPESFRQEGHYAVIQSFMKLGDYLLLHFPWRKKLVHEELEEYQTEIAGFIEETRAMGAYPILATPSCGNTWYADGVRYKDKQADSAKVCCELASTYHVPLMDLHQESKRVATARGYEGMLKFFCQGSEVNLNDYGAYFMAGLAIRQYQEQMKKRKTDAYTRLAAFMMEGNR